MLKAENISFHYPKTRHYIFKDVSLEIKRGTITALLGPSGVGKTTLLKCLALLENPTSGQLTIDKTAYSFPQPKNAPPLTPPWPRLTVVFQQLFLWPHLTLRQNILLPMSKNKDKEEVEKRLQELVELFDMQGFLDRYPNETSRGQQQRAALARALILQPHFILCDEITSALDIEQIGKVLECLNQAKGRNVGILLITHQLAFAQHSADQVLFMDGGHIVEHGDKTCLSHPQTERFAQFLKIVKAAR